MGVPIVEDFQHIFVGPLHASAQPNVVISDAVRDAILLSFLESREVLLTFNQRQVVISRDEITKVMVIRLEKGGDNQRIAGDEE